MHLSFVGERTLFVWVETSERGGHFWASRRGDYYRFGQQLCCGGEKFLQAGSIIGGSKRKQSRLNLCQRSWSQRRPKKTGTMLVQHHHPIPLPSLSPPLSPEYSHNPHISSPSMVQLFSTSRSPPNPMPGPQKETTEKPFTLRRATIKDASAIARLGAQVFSTSFGFSIPTHDLNAYLREAYTTEAIEEDIKCPTKHIIVACAGQPVSSNSNDLELSITSTTSSDTSHASTASLISRDSHPPYSEEEDQDGEVIGFTQLTENTTEPCLSHLPGLVELQRLYVSRTHQGLGTGKRLAREIELVARNLGYKAIWLGVWEGNFKAQRVYEGLGYSKVGDHEFKMGKCIQMDWIMCKDL